MGDKCEAMVASSRMYRGGLLGGALKEMQPSQEPGRAWPPQPWCDRIPILSLYNWTPCHHLYATRQNGIAPLSWDKFVMEIQSVGIQPCCDRIPILSHYTTGQRVIICMQPYLFCKDNSNMWWSLSFFSVQIFRIESMLWTGQTVYFLAHDLFFQKCSQRRLQDIWHNSLHIRGSRFGTFVS